MDDSWARLVIFSLGDPHGLEGAQGAQDGASNPDGVLSLRRGNDLDLHGRGCQGNDFLVESFGNAWEHGGTTRQDDVAIKVLSDIDVALHDGLEGQLMDTSEFLAQFHGLEESLRASESLVSDGDGVTIGKLVGLVHSRAFGVDRKSVV